MYSKAEAAYLILKDYNKPLHAKEIIRIALTKKMIETKGKTPEATLGADLYTENKRRTKRGKGMRFTHVGPAMWALAEWGIEENSLNVDKSKKSVKKTNISRG